MYYTLYLSSWHSFFNSKLQGTTYFPKVFSTRIVLYFYLDDFINFLAVHMKATLPKTEHLYFSSSSCVLPRVVVPTSSILRIILLFFETLRQDFALPKVQPCTPCCHGFVLLIVIVYTSHIYCVYFLK
jgi:hypothetical protein